MLEILTTWFRKRAVGKLVHQLPLHLAKRYGKSDYYTARQIEVALDEFDYSKKYRGYAYVLFMKIDDAAATLGSTQATEKMVEELSVWFFGGQRDFRPRWMVRANTTEAKHTHNNLRY